MSLAQLGLGTREPTLKDGNMGTAGPQSVEDLKVVGVVAGFDASVLAFCHCSSPNHLRV